MRLREKAVEVTAVQANTASFFYDFKDMFKVGRLVDKMKSPKPHIMVATPNGMLRAAPDEYIIMDCKGQLHVLSNSQMNNKYERVE